MMIESFLKTSDLYGTNKGNNLGYNHLNVEVCWIFFLHFHIQKVVSVLFF